MIVIMIPIQITRLCFGPGRATWPTDSPRPTHFDRLGRSRSRSSRPESPRVARPSRSERQKSTEKGARDAPRRDFRRFRVDFRVDFRGFSRLHRASDSTRSAKGRTSVLTGRRGTKHIFRTLRKNRKSTKIVEKSLRRRFANEPREENSIFSLPDATWRRFWSPRRAPGRSWAHFLASPGALGDPPGAPGARRGRPKTLLRRSQDASGTLLGATGHPERVPGPILTRFWVPRDLCRDRFWFDFRVDFRTHFASELASACHNVTARQRDRQSRPNHTHYQGDTNGGTIPVEVA